MSQQHRQRTLAYRTRRTTDYSLHASETATERDSGMTPAGNGGIELGTAGTREVAELLSFVRDLASMPADERLRIRVWLPRPALSRRRARRCGFSATRSHNTKSRTSRRSARSHRTSTAARNLHCTKQVDTPRPGSDTACRVAAKAVSRWACLIAGTAVLARPLSAACAVASLGARSHELARVPTFVAIDGPSTLDSDTVETTVPTRRH
jgi:hypothetical protein